MKSWIWVLFEWVWQFWLLTLEIKMIIKSNIFCFVLKTFPMGFISIFIIKRSKIYFTLSLFIKFNMLLLTNFVQQLHHKTQILFYFTSHLSLPTWNLSLLIYETKKPHFLIHNKKPIFVFISIYRLSTLFYSSL